jgi:hypothetical protein
MEFKLDDNQVTCIKLWKDKHVKYCPIKKDVMRWYTVGFVMNDKVRIYAECACGSRINLSDVED